MSDLGEVPQTDVDSLFSLESLIQNGQHQGIQFPLGFGLALVQ